MLRSNRASASDLEKPAFSKPACVAWYEQLVPTSAPKNDRNVKSTCQYIILQNQLIVADDRYYRCPTSSSWSDEQPPLLRQTPLPQVLSTTGLLATLALHQVPLSTNDVACNLLTVRGASYEVTRIIIGFVDTLDSCRIIRENSSAPKWVLDKCAQFGSRGMRSSFSNSTGKGTEWIVHLMSEYQCVVFPYPLELSSEAPIEYDCLSVFGGFQYLLKWVYGTLHAVWHLRISLIWILTADYDTLLTVTEQAVECI